MNDKKIIDKKEVYNNFLDRAVNMANQGKQQNILTPAFYDAVRIGKDFFDLSQEEVYDEIEKRLSSMVREEDDKDPVTTVDDISSSYMTKINAQVNSPKAFANAILDFINKVQDKEQMDFTKNQKIKYAIQYLQQLQEASEEDVENQKEYNKELQITAKLQDKLKERIAHKVREKLDKESLEEDKESTAEIKQRIKDLVQKLRDKNDYLYPEGAKDLAIDMIKKMDIKEEATDLKVGDRVIYDKTGEEFEVIEVNTDRLVTGRDGQGEQKILTTRHISKIDEIKEALESMGTADEETMKYLLQDIGREELVNFEKQFVVMFDLLRDIRYDGSEQLSKGASEISQRIHNFITIFRQALKGNPVVKEDNTQSLTNNHSNPVTEAAKKKLVNRINSIALQEGISKKEATIKAIKALKESK